MREEEDLLSVEELAEWLKIKPLTVYKKIHTRVFLKNVHYVRPKGLRPRFIRAAIIRWLKEDDKPTPTHLTYPLPDRDKETIRRA